MQTSDVFVIRSYSMFRRSLFRIFIQIYDTIYLCSIIKRACFQFFPLLCTVIGEFKQAFKFQIFQAFWGSSLNSCYSLFSLLLRFSFLSCILLIYIFILLVCLRAFLSFLSLFCCMLPFQHFAILYHRFIRRMHTHGHVHN